jgi:hypothetical protein
MKRGVLLLTVGALVLAACAPTQAPLPTYTPYPTYTSVPAALPTDTPMPAVPAGWRSYETLSGNMSFAYPASWKVNGERVNGVSLTSGTIVVDVNYFPANVAPGDDEQAMQLLLSTAASSYENSFGSKNFTVVDRGGVWDVGVGRAYYCETLAYLTQIGGDDTPVSQRWVMLLLDDGQKQVGLSYASIGSTRLTDTGRDTLRTLVGTVRVR